MRICWENIALHIWQGFHLTTFVGYYIWLLLSAIGYVAAMYRLRVPASGSAATKVRFPLPR